MIKLGTQDISALRLGAQGVKKAYLGEALVLGAETTPSRLPDGYTEVEYIQSDSDCRIYLGSESGYGPGATRLMLDIMPISHSGGSDFIFCDRNQNGYYFNAFTKDISALSYRLGSSGILTKDISIYGNRITIDYNARTKTFKVGDTAISVDQYKAGWIGSGMNLFAYSTVSKSVAAKLYSAKMYRYNSSTYAMTLKFDLVPCINPSGIIGLYDLVGKYFYSNQNSGVFTAGPRI